MPGLAGRRQPAAGAGGRQWRGLSGPGTLPRIPGINLTALVG